MKSICELSPNERALLCSNKGRVVHLPSGQSGNCCDILKRGVGDKKMSFVVMFTHYETIGNVKMPRFQEFPAHETFEENTLVLNRFCIANIVYVDNEGKAHGQSLTNCTVKEMKEYVSGLLGYVPKWLRIEVVGGQIIILLDV